MTGQKYYVIDLYIDWAYGRDEEVTQSDVIYYCEKLDFDYDEIKTLGDKQAKELGL